MKTVVITGSTRGLGWEMAQLFHKNGWNVCLNGVNETRLAAAIEKLRTAEGGGQVDGFAGSVASSADIQALIDRAVASFGSIDIWINNAGVNQPMRAIWELTEAEIDAVLNIDLRGAILGSRLAALQMEKQSEGGFIYNIEGYGSDYCPARKVSIKGNTFIAVRIASEEWGHKAANGKKTEWCYLFAVKLSKAYGNPEVYVENNKFNVTGRRAENVHVLLFRTNADDPARKPDIWPDRGKATFKGNQSLGNAAKPLIVGIAGWYIARNYGRDAKKTYNTMALFDTTSH
jgi:short-subunit dehydrogenase involved in D-alanine esterification of teichoic acids